MIRNKIRVVVLADGPRPQATPRQRTSRGNQKNRFRELPLSNLSVALAVSLALSAAAAKAQTPTEETKTMPKVSVAAPEPDETPKVDRISSPKFTQDLVDTPQTIAVV